VDAIQRVSQIACDLPELAELEINPLLAFPDRMVAVDLRARLAPSRRGHSPST
jgi:acetyltransferase